MKSVVVHAPNKYSVEETPKPKPPPGGLLVKVSACGLCGSDLRTLQWGHRKVNLPWIIGHEICGVIVETGRDYQGPWQIGQKICIGPLAYCSLCEFCKKGQYEYCLNYEEIGQKWPGGLAEFIAIPQECVSLGNILPLPEGLDVTLGTLVEPLSSCINSHEKGGGTSDKDIVVFGAGPLGCLHTGLARANGAKRITVIDRNPPRLHAALELGADEVIDNSTPNYKDSLQVITKGNGADLVILAAPSPDAFRQALQVAKRGGVILLFAGFPQELATFNADINLIHYQALHVIGTTIFAPTHYQKALRLISSKKIPFEKIIIRFLLSDFESGARLALERKIVKAVFLT